MIRNYYYLIAGILGILFAVTHALNGQNTVLPLLNIGPVTTETRSAFTYIWHIITIENLLFGLAFLLMSGYKQQQKARLVAWLVALVMLLRWVIIFTITAINNAAGLKNIVVDSVAIFIYCVLIALGTRVKEKPN